MAVLASAGFLMLGLVSTAGPARAAHVACGQTITVSTVLDSNIGPCATGVTVGADNITFDLNGFTISGNPGPGQGPGILLTNRTGVTVTRGIVTEFDAGVAIDGGSGNTVTVMQVLNNRSTTASDFGDGIGIYSSNNNIITKNLAQNNGPYDGIGVLTGNGNLIDQNKIIDNNQNTNNTAGIRLENSGFTPSSNNIVTRNLVQNSGTFGIQVFAGGVGNRIETNQVTTSRLDGIRIFAGGMHNIVSGNIVRMNSGNGISVQAAAGSFPAAGNNHLLNNTSTGNTLNNLLDSNFNCGTNHWHGNQGPPATPPCTLNP
jgi:hypothetical protein